MNSILSNLIFALFLVLFNSHYLKKSVHGPGPRQGGNSPGGTECVRFDIRFQLNDVNRAATFSNRVKCPGNVGLWIQQHQSFFLL